MTRKFLAAPLLLALGLSAFAACSDDSDTPTAAPATETNVPAASSTASAPATPTVLPTPGEAKVPVTGLFSGEPPAGSQPISVTRTLGPRPETPFAPWDGTMAVIYDTKTSIQIDAGSTSQVVFSPDSSRAAWIPASSMAMATVMNLATGAVRTYAEGTNVGFLDDRRLAIHQAATSTWKVFDIDTGQLSSDQSLRPDQAQPGFPSYPPSPAGYYWLITPDPSTALPRGWTGKNNFRLIEISSGATALRFDAVFAAPAGPNEIVLATPLEGVMTNVFVVSIQTGKAEFIARTRYGRGPNWPLSATARYVLWTDNYCWTEGVDPPQGRVKLYDRATRTLVDIDDGVTSTDPEGDRYAKLTPGSSIAWGSFGATALIDSVSLSYTTVLPKVAPPFRNWSPGYRYASYAPGGGHGGLC